MQVMFDAFDGYAINVEVDFGAPREGQTVCIEEVDETVGIVAYCGLRTTTENKAYPIEPHNLDAGQFSAATQEPYQQLTQNTSQRFESQGLSPEDILQNLKSLRAGFEVFDC